MQWYYDPIFLGALASLIAGATTGVGSLCIFFIKELSLKTEDILLSFAAGIMLAASIFSLILPGIEYASLAYAHKEIAVFIVSGGIFVGALLLWTLDRILPHEHFITGPEDSANHMHQLKIARVWLFIIAIIIHNFPEGMAVGVSFFGDIVGGISLTIGIGLQNIPEGLAVSVSLVSLKYSKQKAFWIGFGSGVTEFAGGLLGACLVWLVQPLLPFVLALAAGAMIYVICHEIIPEVHIQQRKTYATFSLITGFVLMMILDTTLG